MGWSIEAYLLADVWAALTGKIHPTRAETQREQKAADPVRSEKMKAWRQRLDEREAEARAKAEDNDQREGG